jgi:hypothetical protein
MSFSRTPSGLAAEYLFYPEILVYVEGHTDIPFYSAVLQNYDCRIRTYREEKGCDKLTEELVKKDLPYVVIVDGHYEMLERTRSQHRRIVLLHRHSYENYLFETEPIEQFCRDRARLKDSLEDSLSSSKFKENLERIEHSFKELIVLDVAHQNTETGYDALPDKPHRFFKSQTRLNFLNSQIQQWRTEAANRIDNQNTDKARTLVEQFLKKRRFVDLLPGHFAFDIIRRLICNTLRKSIENEEIRLYFSRVVWELVNTRDHNSLKRRLQSAVREVGKMQQANNSQAQSNTRS